MVSQVGGGRTEYDHSNTSYRLGGQQLGYILKITMYVMLMLELDVESEQIANRDLVSYSCRTGACLLVWLTSRSPSASLVSFEVSQAHTFGPTTCFAQMTSEAWRQDSE